MRSVPWLEPVFNSGERFRVVEEDGLDAETSQKASQRIDAHPFGCAWSEDSIKISVRRAGDLIQQRE